jgi:sugar/nucleoside kinase (ribokinase family)
MTIVKTKSEFSDALLPKKGSRFYQTLVWRIICLPIKLKNHDADNAREPIMSKKKTVVAGHICLDVIPDFRHLPAGQFEQLFQPGHLVSAGEADFSTGGPVSNVGLALHRLGIPTQLIAKIGNDPFGRAVTRLIQGVDENLLGGLSTHNSAPTSYSIIISPPGVDRIFFHCSGVNDLFSSTDIDWELIQEADLLHFGYPPIMAQMYQNEGDELTRIFERAKTTGITTSLDMTFPDPASEGGIANWKVILRKALPFVDIFTPSIEEILFMLRRDEYEQMNAAQGGILENLSPDLLTDLSDELLTFGAKIVVLKLGHKGLHLRTGSQKLIRNLGRAAPSDSKVWADQELWSPCFTTDVVGTTGAGDATIAGFLSALLRDLPPGGAINAAVGVGACNVEGSDALSGLRSWEETLSRINHGWKKHHLKVDHSDWRWDQINKLWIKEQGI